MSDGATLTAWQKAVIAEWHRRHPKPLVWSSRLGEIPLVARGVYCARCSTPAVMLPGESLSFPENKGSCICPRCSAPKSVLRIVA